MLKQWQSIKMKFWVVRQTIMYIFTYHLTALKRESEDRKQFRILSWYYDYFYTATPTIFSSFSLFKKYIWQMSSTTFTLSWITSECPSFPFLCSLLFRSSFYFHSRWLSLFALPDHQEIIHKKLTRFKYHYHTTEMSIGIERMAFM